MSNLIPVPSPALAPLANSYEASQLETELKALFMSVFEGMIRDRERNLNLYGMAHLGGDDLMASALKSDGIAMVKRSSTRMQFLMKANRSRNPRRGLLFIKKYLQAIWPNIWLAEPLWMRLNDTANYPANAIPMTKSVAVAAGITGDYSDGSGRPVALYRTDATGTYPLYSTPRWNFIRNNTMVGAAAGSTNKLPTNWSSAYVSGIALQVVGTGTVNGVSYIDLQFSGTNTTSGNCSLSFEFPTYIAAAAGAQWTGSAFVALVAGSLAGVDSMALGYRDGDGSGALLASGVMRAIAPTATLTRYSGTHTVPAGATRTNLQFRWNYPAANATTNFTIRIGLPQYEPGSVATMPIPAAAVTAPVAVTDYTVAADTGLATFRADFGLAPTCVYYFLTGRVRITLPVQSDNGLGLTEIARAFRSTLPARLMLEFKLGTTFSNTGSNGVALANGVIGIMPFTAIGKLKT
jgi:hypothetical protein